MPHASTAAAIIAALSSLRRTSVRTNCVSAPVVDASSSAVARPFASFISAIEDACALLGEAARDAGADAVAAARDHRDPLVQPSHAVPLVAVQ